MLSKKDLEKQGGWGRWGAGGPRGSSLVWEVIFHKQSETKTL